MAVYYKFKSARDYDSISMDGPFISVGTLKEKIFESKHLGRGTDFDLVITNAQTNEEYLDEAMLIPKNTSVLIQRVPGRPRMPIVTEQEQKVEYKVENSQPEKDSFLDADQSMKYPDDSEWDEFGNDLYAIPESFPVQSMTSITDVALTTTKADEDSKIKALIETPALDWQRQGTDGFGGPGRGFGRGMAGRMGGRGFGMERKTPPQGYTCHRCKVPGHFIQHCPTNGDPNYDIKRVKPPTGIPKSMLMATPDGSYALPSGVVAVLRPNEAAFEKEIEGLPSTRSVGDLPPEFHCPLCKEVMKDAVLTSKCCFKSFCDKCIRDHIISRSACVCGATNILADDLLPNKTLRDTINRILESGNSSAENAGSTYQVPDMESARCPPPKMPSPTLSAASKRDQDPIPFTEETPGVNETVNEGNDIAVLQQTSEKMKTEKVPDVSEATLESMSVKEPASQGSVPLAEEEVQQKLAAGEIAKKKKKKKVRMPGNAAEMQWNMSQDLAAENYIMPMGPTAYNPYWNGMQPGMESFGTPYGGAMPYMGYGLGPFDMPFGGVMPQDPFGAQAYMMPMVPPQRDLAGFGMGFNGPRPIMSREGFEARKADLRRKRENERRVQGRDFPKEREFGREVSSSVDAPPMRSKPPPPSSSDQHRHRNERSSVERYDRGSEPQYPPKRKAEHDRDRSSVERYDRGSEPQHPPKRKAEHDRDRSSVERQHPPKRKGEHDRDCDHHHDRDRERQRDREYHSRPHHGSESSSRPPPSSSEAAATAAKPDLAAIPATSAADRKHKPSVFSRISFPEGEASKKRKSSSESPSNGASRSAAHPKASANGHNDDGYTKSSSKKKNVPPPPAAASGRMSSTAASADYESSDDDRHFKRKPSRYEPSPPRAANWEEPKPRHSRNSRDREHDRYGSKHR